MADLKKLRRREIIKFAALGAGVGALGGLSGKQIRAADDNDKVRLDIPDAVVDILIVGAGNAGMPAAIQAADLGAKVLLLDKNPFVGGMLNISGGHISGADSKVQIAKGIEDSPASHYRDAMRMGRYRNNSELLKIAVENAAAMIDWLVKIGVEFTPESPFLEDDHDHYSAPRTYVGPDYARSLLGPFRTELEKRIERGDVTLRLNTRVTRLIRDDAGKIIGVAVVDGAGNSSRLMAKAVILATGGYGASEELKEKYNRKIAKSKVICLSHATGDGIVMAEQVGANLTNMDIFISFPGTVKGASGRLQHPPDHYIDGIWVNQQGLRFVNEHADSPDERERAFLEQADLGFFYVFDERIKNRDNPGGLDWTQEQLRREISRGVVKKATSIRQLAARIGVNANRLSRTVTKYNNFVTRGVDEEFNRVKLGDKLTHRPFYSIPITGSILISHGGVSVNHSLQVTDNNAKVIPGLYAVGETLGCAQMMGSAVLSGMSVGPAITLGRIAARNACQYAQYQQDQTQVCAESSA